MRSPRRSFDHVARPYALLERALLGRALERARFRYLPRLQGASRILALGEGDGRCVDQLLRVTGAQIDVVERSETMMLLAQRRTGMNSRVRWHRLDARDFSPQGRYDAVLTLFFLDCFESQDVDLLIGRVLQHLAPGGLWLYADFQQGSGDTERRNHFVIASLYGAFAMLTDIEARRLVDPRPSFERHGLQRLGRWEQRRGLITSEVWTTSSSSIEPVQKPSQGFGG